MKPLRKQGLFLAGKIAAKEPWWGFGFLRTENWRAKS
jgi:hypothetical protein